MTRIRMTTVVVLILLASGACNRTAPSTQTAPGGTVLVKDLPAGAEGLELRDGALRVKDGYEFVKGPGGTFSVRRITVPTPPDPPSGGGCGCSSGTDGCAPVLKGGIIVCEGGCGTGSCGLALTVGGVKTDVIRF